MHMHARTRTHTYPHALLLDPSPFFLTTQVPVKSDIMLLIPWHKMQQRQFGINHRGIFSVDKNTGKVRREGRRGIGRREV